MATKPKDMASAMPNAIVEAVAASAQQIWQAGLGAYARAQQDGGEIFDRLVRDGAALHELTQQLSGDKYPGVAGKIGRLAENVGRQASGSWDKLEKLFEDRVARSLHNLGVPSREDIEALRREIDALKAAMPGPDAQHAAIGAPAAQPAARHAKTAVKRTPTKSGAGAAPKRSPKAAGARS
jgi:poly(hydroxyalkanoate) granule-associated protein